MNGIFNAGLYLLGQAADAGAAQVAAGDVQVQSIWDFMVKGGPVMIPIGLCSLIAVTVIVERLISLRRTKVIPSGFVSGLKPIIDRNGDGYRGALEYCERDGSPIANILAAGIRSLGFSVEILEKHIAQAGQREILNLRKYLRMLSLIASIAPLLGLLGTITGMIKAFQTVAAAGETLGRTEALAKGIYEAMITTAAGLMVAIPVLIAYHWLAGKIESLVAEMDRMTIEFVERHALRGPAESDDAAKSDSAVASDSAAARVVKTRTRRLSESTSLDAGELVTAARPDDGNKIADEVPEKAG